MSVENTSFEPRILAFCYTWCSYAAADLAGTSRMQYPPNVRIIRVMCSGMVHPEMILSALRKGADGVMVLG
jgi:F420-non-reducing hydrogenase iron-sulfur subunit